VGSCGSDESRSGQVQVAAPCEHSNEPSGSKKGGEFLDYLSDLIANQEGLSSIHLVGLFFH
jgi:hypothetical protein